MSVSVITIPADVTFSANDIYFKLQSSYNYMTFPDNYTIIAMVLLRPTPGNLDPYDELTRLELRPDRDGYVDFNISSILDKAMRNRFTGPPIPDETNIQDPYVAPLAYEYAVNIYERSGNPPVDGSTTNIIEGVAVLGGIDRTKWHRTYLSDIVSSDEKCIWSRIIPHRRIGRNQLHWLSYWNASATPSTIECTIITYDDDLAVISTDVLTATVDAYCPVSFPSIFTINTGTSIPRLFSMQITSGGSSLVYNFVVDNHLHEDDRHLIYLNGYNTLEALRCTGAFIKEIEASRMKSTALDTINGVATSKRETHQVGVDWGMIYTYRTGYIGKREVEALDEMFVINMVWEWYGNLFRSLDLIEDSKQFLDTGSMLDALEFQATDAVKKKIIPLESRI